MSRFLLLLGSLWYYVFLRCEEGDVEKGDDGGSGVRLIRDDMLNDFREGSHFCMVEITNI